MTSAVVDAQTRARARDAVAQIVARVEDAEDSFERGALAAVHDGGLGGPAGVALGLTLLARALGDHAYLRRAQSFLAAATNVSAQPQIGLYTGLTGLYVAVAALEDAGASFSRLRNSLERELSLRIPLRFAEPFVRARSMHDYDLVSGAAGILLSRIDDAVDAQLAKYCFWLLDDDERWKAPHPLAERAGSRNDVGLAHGAPGVLLALARYRADHAVFGPALRRIVRCITFEGGVASIPSFIDSRAPAPARVAWCYGIPGVAVALSAFEQTRALAADALLAALKSPRERWTVCDVAPCHGLTGIALCAHSVYEKTGDERCASAATALLEEILLAAQSDDYRCIDRAVPDDCQERHGLLDGAIGTAVALLALTGDLALRDLWFFGVA